MYSQLILMLAATSVEKTPPSLLSIVWNTILFLLYGLVIGNGLIFLGTKLYALFAKLMVVFKDGVVRPYQFRRSAMEREQFLRSILRSSPDHRS